MLPYNKKCFHSNIGVKKIAYNGPWVNVKTTVTITALKNKIINEST